MPHTVEVKNTSYSIPFGSFVFVISSYRIESSASFISKPTVNGSIILQQQGIKPSIITIKGKFHQSQTPIAPILNGFTNGRTSFSLVNHEVFRTLFIKVFVMNQ